MQVDRLKRSLQETSAKLVDSQQEVTSVQLSSERAVSNMVSKVQYSPRYPPCSEKLVSTLPQYELVLLAGHRCYPNRSLVEPSNDHLGLAPKVQR